MTVNECAGKKNEKKQRDQTEPGCQVKWDEQNHFVRRIHELQTRYGLTAPEDIARAMRISPSDLEKMQNAHPDQED